MSPSPISRPLTPISALTMREAANPPDRLTTTSLDRLAGHLLGGVDGGEDRVARRPRGRRSTPLRTPREIWWPMPTMRGRSPSTRAMKQQILVVPISSAATKLPRGRAGLAASRPAWLSPRPALLPRLGRAAADLRSRHVLFAVGRPFLAAASLAAPRRTHDQPVRQAHVDRRDVALRAGWSLRSSAARSVPGARPASSSGSATSMPLSSRRFQRRPPTRTAAVDPRGELGLARQHAEQVAPRAPARRRRPARSAARKASSRSAGITAPLAVDQHELAVVLPEGERLALDQADEDRVGQAPLDPRPSAPRAALRAAPWRAPGRRRGSACRA